ncbi:hypothetical protein BEWA_037720 [Theileria equi strain WA]|uniref:Uncharacterized protein n=1 Tax=Theileria equi strain WA TaxID=1537102 RepID=L1LEQ8_THEEQ|nr:hypothetical protein BEWA_037720 [Theileria equi strain WA]EKX73735.1 hypothetical protein BEWA_037720 [Theileria equi strain WA]|eukprot:XP_004833187.1 hypothetical protein BEWA_037720 [Theileria equi strain WA]
MYAHITNISNSGILNSGKFKDDIDYNGIHPIHEKFNHLLPTYIGQPPVQTAYPNTSDVNQSPPIVNGQPTPMANTSTSPPPYSGDGLKQDPSQAVVPQQPVPGNNETKVPEVTQTEEKVGENKDSIACTRFWFIFSYCNSNTQVTPETAKSESNGNVTPVISQNCNPYGTGNVSLSDFKETNDNGWIVVNENNTPKITRNRQVASSIPSTLQLKNTLCNAFEVRATIKLSENSSGGIMIRGSDKNMTLVELNITTKTVSLKLLNDTSQELIAEQVYDRMNSQFIHYISIKDTGYKGGITVEIDDNKVINQDGQISTTSGTIGVFVSSGNATFGDLSVSPITT